MDTMIFYTAAAATCIVILLLVYRSLKAPFFLFLSAAAFFMACASIALVFSTTPEAGALSDLSLALCGASLGAASLQLTYSFRLAGDGLD